MILLDSIFHESETLNWNFYRFSAWFYTFFFICHKSHSNRIKMNSRKRMKKKQHKTKLIFNFSGVHNTDLHTEQRWWHFICWKSSCVSVLPGAINSVFFSFLLINNLFTPFAKSFENAMHKLSSKISHTKNFWCRNKKREKKRQRRLSLTFVPF